MTYWFSPIKRKRSELMERSSSLSYSRDIDDCNSFVELNT